MALVVVIAGLAVRRQCRSRGTRRENARRGAAGAAGIRLPGLERSDLNTLLPLAMACFLLGAVETAAIGRMFARKHEYRLDSNQEFLALAGANLAAGLGQGFPTSGGMSQSLVNEIQRRAHAAFRIHLLPPDPAGHPVSIRPAAPPAAAGAGRHRARRRHRTVQPLRAQGHVADFSRGDFAVAIAALVGVLGSGLLMGVLIGAVLSLALLLRRAMQPPTTELGRVPGTDYFADRIRHPKTSACPASSSSAAMAASSTSTRNTSATASSNCLDDRDSDEVKLAVFFMGTVPLIDMAGVEFLTELHETLKKRGIELRLAETHSMVRETLRRGVRATLRPRRTGPDRRHRDPPLAGRSGEPLRRVFC